MLVDTLKLIYIPRSELEVAKMGLMTKLLFTVNLEFGLVWSENSIIPSNDAFLMRILYRGCQSHTAAIWYFDKALAIDPHNVPTLTNQGAASYVDALTNKAARPSPDEQKT